MKKACIITALALFLLSCLFPPWQQTYDRNGDSGGHSIKSVGHEFVLSPPQPASGNYYGVRIDFGVLFVEWLLIGGIASASFLPPVKISRRAVAISGGVTVFALIVLAAISYFSKQESIPTWNSTHPIIKTNANPFDRLDTTAK